MRILMLGNSLTSTADLPAKLAEALGAEVLSSTRGGAHLAEHLNKGTALGARSQALLEDGPWDAVVLQETSTGPIRSRAAYLRSATALCAAVRAAGATPVLYGTWAPAEGSARLMRLGIDRHRCAELLREAFVKAAGVCGAVVADVGAAFMEAPDEVALLATDGVHPSEEGARVAAAVIAGAVTAALARKAAEHDRDVVHVGAGGTRVDEAAGGLEGTEGV